MIFFVAPIRALFGRLIFLANLSAISFSTFTAQAASRKSKEPFKGSCVVNLTLTGGIQDQSAHFQLGRSPNFADCWSQSRSRLASEIKFCPRPLSLIILTQYTKASGQSVYSEKREDCQGEFVDVAQTPNYFSANGLQQARTRQPMSQKTTRQDGAVLPIPRIQAGWLPFNQSVANKTNGYAGASQ